MSAACRPQILSMCVDPTSYADASALVCEWAREGLSKYVCVAPVSSVMEAHDSADFQSIMNQADLVTPDGMAVVWSLRLLGFRDASRVYGPDLTEVVLEMAAARDLPVGFHGGSPAALRRLVDFVSARYPNLHVVWACSPPFRELSAEEENATIEEINQSGARILFVGLGSPKQERWMAARKGRIHSVMLGVGAAFDFLSGAKPQAPRWMMRIGMEWFFRLVSEPRRMWKRYLKHNPRFVFLFALQLLRLRIRHATAAPSGA